MIVLDENKALLRKNRRKAKPLSLTESRGKARTLDGRILMEDILNLKKKPRSVKDALDAAKGACIKGYNPYDTLYQLYVKGKGEVKKLLEREFKKAKKDEDKITFSANFIKDSLYVQPENGILEFGVHIYMPAKKGFFAKLFTGSMGNWFSELGVKAIQTFVKCFAGDAFAKQVSKKTVFNAIGEHENEGKTSYFCCLKIPEAKG